MTDSDTIAIVDRVKLPSFKDMKVSTKTFIGFTNLCINLDQLYEALPVNDTRLVQKCKGRRRSQTFALDESSVTDGAIVALRYRLRTRGVEINTKKTKKIKKWFRNSFTVEMYVQGKTINFKVYSNGIFQITGCKLDSQAEMCVKTIWELIKEKKGTLYTFSKDRITGEDHDHMITMFIPAMRNVDFDLGFIIDREKLTEYVSTKTEHLSLLECSYGYTGVNIKIKIDKPITEMKIKKIEYFLSDTDSAASGTYVESMTTYSEYLDQLTERERLKKLNKARFTSILAFHSGRIIVSSIQEEFALETFDKFVEIVRESRDYIEERLDL